MFEIREGTDGVVLLSGRFDATQVERAKSVLLGLPESRVLDFTSLDYISSAGLGVLLAAQKRLSQKGQSLKLINVNSHIRDVLHFSGFDQIFELE